VLGRLYREAERLSLVVEGLDAATGRALLRPTKELNLDHGCIVDADEFAPTFRNGRKHSFDGRFELGVISELSATAVPNQNHARAIESCKEPEQPLVSSLQRGGVGVLVADARDPHDVVKGVVFDTEMFALPERPP